MRVVEQLLLPPESFDILFINNGQLAADELPPAPVAAPRPPRDLGKHLPNPFTDDDVEPLDEADPYFNPRTAIAGILRRLLTCAEMKGEDRDAGWEPLPELLSDVLRGKVDVIPKREAAELSWLDGPEELTAPLVDVSYPSMVARHAGDDGETQCTASFGYSSPYACGAVCGVIGSDSALRPLAIRHHTLVVQCVGVIGSDRETRRCGVGSAVCR